MQITKEQIMDLKKSMLDYVREKGPVIPINLSKATGSTTIFAGAVLSEMIAQRQVKLTNAKIGSSPLYYCPGQEEKLVMLRQYLGQRPKEAFDTLKEQKILHDRSCEPWQRVALREIKDFAMPIYIEINGQQEIFWRWYLLPEEDAIKEIKNTLEEEEKKNLPKEEPKIAAEETKPAALIEETPEPTKTEIPIIEEIKEAKPKKQRKKKEKKPENNFYMELLKMFNEKKIGIMEQKVLKPGKEFNFVIKVPSPLGQLNYLAIAKNKKKVSDSDISMAFSEGLNSKMPVMYISSGELSKKAEKYIESSMKGVVFKKI